MDYMKVSEAAAKCGLSTRRVRILCQENRIEGVIRKGNLFMIPTEAKKLEDGRSKGRNRTALKKLLDNIDKNFEKLSNIRPLTKGEVERLRDEFLIEFTYNSNAIEGNTLTPVIDVKFSDRRKYYQAFDGYYRNHNELPMVEMVAGYVNERLEKYLSLFNT